jgi:5'-nucleotidase
MRRGWWWLAWFGVAWAIAQGLGSWPARAFSPRATFDLRLLHTNDHHAHLEAVDGRDPSGTPTTLGGIARRKTAIAQLRAASDRDREPLLLLDAGDVFQGTLYFNYYAGLADRGFYNDLAYDAMTVGNHEFDRGQQVLADFLAGLEFPVVAANLAIAPDAPLAALVRPSVVKELGGERVGIVGLTTPETLALSNPGAGVSFLDPVEAARRAVADLERQGVHKIIALTHLGLTADLALAAAVDGIDVVIGGHSHTPLGPMPGAEQPYPIATHTPNGDPVLIVTDWEWGKYLGNLRVRFDRRGRLVDWDGQPVALDAAIAPDPDYERRLADLAQPLEDLRHQIVGETLVELVGDHNRLRSEEMPLGNLVADAVLDRVAPAGAVAALLNGGSLRAGLPQGTVMMGDVLEVLPFGTTVGYVDLTGAQVWAALEHGLAEVEDRAGSYPQVAGLRFQWDPTQPAGQRLIQVDIRDPAGTFQPVDPTAIYRIATNAFVMGGGDGYTMMAAGVNLVDTGFVLADVLADYLKARSPVRPSVEGRVLIRQPAAVP